ncbi:MAG TPA: beta-N-acetylhexosaminidase [Firmicutes bacterium]|nr:beta-N-acetylhexosaminidase [Bacillota bacterium]
MKLPWKKHSIFLLIFLVIAVFAEASLPREYQRILDSMTLEEKVGQMLLLGVPGTYITNSARSAILELNAGGLVLFAGNLTTVDQARDFTSRLQAEAMKTKWQIPLLITADEEGGLVSRMPAGMVTMPGNMALGATRSELLVQKAYYHTGRQLRALGINMNLAPVLDVNNNPQNPVIGLRSFGSDPVLVGNMGVAALEGLKKANVGSIVKHFPGHGDTATDSHLALPIVRKGKDQLAKMELYPFKQALDYGAMAVMTAHIEFPALIGGKNLPATLSQEILTGILRANWGYDGVICTDDLTMSAIANYFGFQDAVVLAVKAGVDQVLIVGDINRQKEAKQAIIDAVNRGEISEARITKSVERIFLLKSELNLNPGKIPELLDPKKEANDAQKVALDVALNSVTMIKNDGELLKPKQKVLLAVVDGKLMGASGRDGTTIGYLLQRELVNRGFGVEVIDISSRPSLSQQQQVLSRAASVDSVVVLSRNASNEQAQVIQKLLHKPLITVALQNPYDILKYPDVKVHLLTYGYTEASLKALVSILTGENKAIGQLPVKLSENYIFGYKE